MCVIVLLSAFHNRLRILSLSLPVRCEGDMLYSHSTVTGISLALDPSGHDRRIRGKPRSIRGQPSNGRRLGWAPCQTQARGGLVSASTGKTRVSASPLEESTSRSQSNSPYGVAEDSPSTKNAVVLRWSPAPALCQRVFYGGWGSVDSISISM